MQFWRVGGSMQFRLAWIPAFWSIPSIPEFSEERDQVFIIHVQQLCETNEMSFMWWTG